MFSATTYINFKQAEKVNENSNFFSKSTTIVRHTNRFQRNILNMGSGLRGYLFTGEIYFIQAYDSAAMENIDILKELSTVISESSFQKKSLIEIDALNDQWLNNYAKPLINAKKMAGLSDSSQLQFQKMYGDKLLSATERTLNRRLQQKFRDFSNYEYSLRDSREVELTNSITNTRLISFCLTTFSIIIGLAIAIFLATRISAKIMRMVKLADDIAAGEYDAPVIDEGRDELGSLAKSLNNMSKVLSENISLLQRKNVELSQFAHIVSHDLKAPLRGIDNVVTWIEEDHTHELSSKMKEYLSLIKGRLIRAEKLIQGILMYSRIGRELPEKEDVDLNTLILETLEPLAPNTQLNIQIQKNLPVINTERIPLQQVLSNLIVNAIKYHDKDNGLINVSFKNDKDYYTFNVMDNGPGIDKSYHEKIFVIFQTLQERDSFESTGVGLAIVKKILEDRKQLIKVISSPNKGSIFTFTWPK